MSPDNGNFPVIAEQFVSCSCQVASTHTLPGLVDFLPVSSTHCVAHGAGTVWPYIVVVAL